MARTTGGEQPQNVLSKDESFALINRQNDYYSRECRYSSIFKTSTIPRLTNWKLLIRMIGNERLNSHSGMLEEHIVK